MSNPKIIFNAELNLNFESESGLASLQEVFDRKKQEIEERVKSAVDELGDMTLELMVTTIENNGSVRTHGFADSIAIQKNGLSFVVGSTLGTIVPTVIEEGRSGITATNARCLHFVEDGKEYFVKSVSGYEGAPYIAPTAEAISNVAKDVILNHIVTG